MIYKVHNHAINNNLRTVSVDGAVLNVEPKVYDLIFFLVSNPNKAISKDELMNEVWPGLEISETAITRAIMKARKCLNDGKDSQSYIQTIHGHGYKLVADVEIVDEPLQKAGNSNQQHWWLKNKALAVIIFTALLSFVGVAIIYSSQDTLDNDSKLAVLPVINKTNNKDFSWVSLGLMSLAVQMIQAENGIQTISNSASSRVKDIEIDDDFKVADNQVSSLKDQLKATHLVFSMLENTDDDQFKLSYSVYHPKGKQDVIELIGKNPTDLTQKMVNQITNKLPSATFSTPKFKVISDNVFTNELYARGVAHRLEGDAKAAREYFSLVIKEEPDLFWPRYQFALTSNKLGQYDEAIESLEQLLIDIPKILNDKDLEAGVNNAIGISYMQKSDHEKGIEYYSNAFEIAKQSGNRDYQEKIASNIAWIYKDKKDLEKSRVWLAKSIESRKGLDLPPNINNLYLKGQLAYLSNNFDKAETIFAEAFQLYDNANLNRQAAKVLNLRAQIQNLNGNWSKAHQIVDQSFQLSEKVDDDLGRLNSHSKRSQVYLNEGKYSDALIIIQDGIDKSATLNQDSKTLSWRRQEINVLFKQKNYQLASEKLGQLPADDKPMRKGQINSMQLKRVQIEYINGNKQPLIDWLENYKKDDENFDLKSNYRIKKLNLFMLEQDFMNPLEPNGPEESGILIEAYRGAIKLERQLGYQANIAHNLIKIAYIYINQDNYTAFEDVLDELHLFDFEWWQIDLLEAFKLSTNNKSQEAKQMAEKAKQNSTESWGVDESKLYMSII